MTWSAKNGKWHGDEINGGVESGVMKTDGGQRVVKTMVVVGRASGENGERQCRAGEIMA